MVRSRLAQHLLSKSLIPTFADSASELVQKPLKLRHMLGQYGELGRVYLAPEGTRLP